MCWPTAGAAGTCGLARRLAAILCAQGAEHAAATPAAIPTGLDSAPANAPRIASPTEAGLVGGKRLSLPSNSSSRYLLALRRKRGCRSHDLGSPCRLCAISSDHQHLWAIAGSLEVASNGLAIT